VSRPAVQLYTVRDHVRNRVGFIDALDRIAAMGYGGVQLSAVGAMDLPSPDVDSREAGALMRDRGLACVATHRPWERLRDHLADEIAFHQHLECTYVAIGGMPREYEQLGAEGYRTFLRDSGPVIARLRDAGLRFGFHNHDREFRRAAPGGSTTLFDVLIDEGGADFHLEIDVYWAWHAGVDPAVLLRRCAGRVPVIHLKDKAVGTGGPEIAAIGEGNLPWDRIFEAVVAGGVEWCAVEQDTCPRDPFDCLASSLRFLQGRLR